MSDPKRAKRYCEGEVLHSATLDRLSHAGSSLRSANLETDNLKEDAVVAEEKSADFRSLCCESERLQRESKVQQGKDDMLVDYCKDTQDKTMAQQGGLQRYLVAVEYVGTRFFGWQKQKNRPHIRTVQGVLEDAFRKFVGQPVTSSGSSRTDTGVHSLANVCHVDVERVSKRKPGEVLLPHEPEIVKKAVNHFLQKDAGDVMVVDVIRVPLAFHARFQARERTYHYRILACSGHHSVFERDRVWFVPEDLNLEAMQEACGVLVGHHDFSSFRGGGCQAKSPLKTLDELHVCEMPSWPCFPSSPERTLPSSIFNGADTKGAGHLVQGGSHSGTPGYLFLHGKERQSKAHCYVVTARARSFLYHQVRLLVGCLKAVGAGLLTVSDVERILNARDITTTAAMAPACGLYLANVKYDLSSLGSEQEFMENEENEGEE